MLGHCGDHANAAEPGRVHGARGEEPAAAGDRAARGEGDGVPGVRQGSPLQGGGVFARRRRPAAAARVADPYQHETGSDRGRRRNPAVLAQEQQM